jgi:hypothetical protein
MGLPSHGAPEIDRLAGAIEQTNTPLAAFSQAQQPDLFDGHCGGFIRAPTAAEIEAAKTPRGAWTRKQLAQWGVPWPPRRGWQRRLIAQSEGQESQP